MIFRKLQLCLTLLILVLMTGPVSAALQINVNDDSGGYYRPGSWVPIVVSISNQSGTGNDGPFEGRIIVESQSYTTQHGSYQFVRDVSVPLNSRKRYILHAKLPDNLGAQFEVTVRRSNGQLVQTIPYSMSKLAPADLFALIVSPDVSRLNFPLLRQTNVSSMQQAFRTTEFLPDTWAGYDTANMVVFTEWPTQMTSTKINALKDWVSMGGTMVMLGGSATQTYNDDAAVEFLPVDLSGSSSYRYNESLSRFEPTTNVSDNDTYLLSQGTVKSDARLLLEVGGGFGEPVPMFVQQDIGKGQVIFMASDLQARSLELSNLLAPYWFSILPEVNRIDWQHQFVDSVQKSLVLVTGSAARPPSAVIIILICILYTLVVGPINFFVLSKMGRIQLAWGTVPVIVFVFSGLIYGLGSLTKGNKSIARETSLVTGKQGQTSYELQSLLGVFVSSERDLNLAARDESYSVADHDRWHTHDEILGYFDSQLDNFGLDFGGATPVVNSTDEGIVVDSWNLKPFDLKRFEVRGALNDAGAIDSTLAYENDTTTFWFDGNLTNNTEWDFYDAALMYAGKGFAIGEMAAGDSISLGRDDTIWRTRGAGQNATNWRIGIDRWLEQTNGDDITDPESDEAITRENVEKILDSILRQPVTETFMAPEHGKLYFVGLAESPELSTDVGFLPDDGQRSTIVMVELNPVPKRGEFTVFEDFVNVRLIGVDSTSQQVRGDFFFENQPQRHIKIRNHEGIFAVELPFHSENLYVRNIADRSSIASSANFQVVEHRVVPFERGQPKIIDKNPIINGTNRYAAPFNGRMFTVLSSTDPVDENGNPKQSNTFSIGGNSQTEIKEIGYRFEGLIE